MGRRRRIYHQRSLRAPQGARLFVGRSDAMGVLDKALADAMDGMVPWRCCPESPASERRAAAKNLRVQPRIKARWCCGVDATNKPGAPPYWPWVQILRSMLMRTPRRVADAGWSGQ